MNKYILLLIIIFNILISAQPYPDQFYTYEKDSLNTRIETSSGIEIAEDTKKLKLYDGITSGTVIFSPDSSEYPFNRGLPSWNGFVPNDNSSFKVVMRFYKNGWSPWMMVGYWKEQIWSTYGATTFNDGEIEYDYVVLNSYYKKWQYAVAMKRLSVDEPSPTIHKLSFFVSDQITTDEADIPSIVNDRPEVMFIPTEHFYQYSLDPDIGGDICSPTSVSMVLRSYDIEVDPVDFANDNYDPHWGLFGVWPRAVQNAVSFNMKGAVTRYRTWSEAAAVLEQGGRIVMSVGRPLYAGHLMMLAGFDSQGNPLVHDPAKTNGYGLKYNKTELSESWFNKGGISYTFFLDSTTTTSVEEKTKPLIADNFELSVYPNPFNPQSNIVIQTLRSNFTVVSIYNTLGQKVETLYEGELDAGNHYFNWNAKNLPSGNYIIHLKTKNSNKTVKAMLLK